MSSGTALPPRSCSALLAFVAYDMRHAALAYLGINPTKPAVEFEIRLPKAALSGVADSQVELHTDRNQTLAQMQGALASDDDGRSVLRGSVPLDYRTTDRVVVLNLPGQAQCEFKLRLPANPVTPISSARGIWPIASPRRPRRRNPQPSRMTPSRSAIACCRLNTSSPAKARTPRPLDSITNAVEYWIIRFRG